VIQLEDSHIQKDVFSRNPIEKDIENLIDLIKIRIGDKSIEEVSESLYSA